MLTASVYYLLFANKKPKILNDFNPEYSYSLVQKGALLIDVRSEEEFNESHIEGAIHIPHTKISREKDLLVKLTEGKKEKDIVVYCRSGARSQAAKESLLKMGYLNVVNHGGISTWKRVK